jgi:hypothetical protein
MRLALPAAALALVCTLAGCGSSAPPASTVTAPLATATNPVASAPGTSTPAPGATTRQATAPPATTAPPASSGARTVAPAAGGSGTTHADGGSEPVRTPAAFTIAGGKLTPPGVTVPPFVAIEVSAVATDGKPHVLVLQLPPSTHVLRVPAQGRASLRIAGVRAGRYGITLDGRIAGGIVVGGAGGP